MPTCYTESKLPYGEDAILERIKQSPMNLAVHKREGVFQVEKDLISNVHMPVSVSLASKILGCHRSEEELQKPPRI